MPEVESADVALGDGQENELENAENAVAEKVGADADANETDVETDKPKKGGWLRKLEKKDAQIASLIQALEKVGGNAVPKHEIQQQNEQDKPPVKPIRPKVKDFSDYDQYETAFEKWEEDRDKYDRDIVAFEVKQSLSKAESEKQQKSQRQTVVDSWAQQVAKAQAEIADFDEVAFNEEVPMSDAMKEAIITSELGAKIAYELGKNPKEADRIARLAPVAAVREIGKIESRIAAKQSAAEEEEDKEPQRAASRAPQPPSIVGKTRGVNSEPADSDDYKTWLKKRNAQLRR